MEEEGRVEVRVLYNYIIKLALLMKDYFKYLTVGELQDQIMDTLISAKQKINRISKKSVDESSFVNDKFYNYVTEIKNKQKKYDYIMNQSQELNCLLNERRKRIDESLERYERNKKCKTLSSFHQNLYRTATSIEVTPPKYDSLHRLNNLGFASQSKLEVEALKYGEKNHTQKGQESVKTKQENSLVKNMQIVKRRQKILTEPLEIIKEKESESKKLRSITKVINIRIDNLPSQKSPQKLFSFAKNTIKYDIEATNNQNVNIEAAKKKIHFSTAPAEPSQNTENKIENPKVQAKPKEKKNTHKLLNFQQKSMKRIRERMKQNQERLLKLQEKQKREECTKMLLLKYEYQNVQRNDVKVKLVSSFATYLKAKQNRNARF